jgi:hypothetical protein
MGCLGCSGKFVLAFHLLRFLLSEAVKRQDVVLAICDVEVSSGGPMSGDEAPEAPHEARAVLSQCKALRRYRAYSSLEGRKRRCNGTLCSGS